MIEQQTFEQRSKNIPSINIHMPFSTTKMSLLYLKQQQKVNTENVSSSAYRKGQTISVGPQIIVICVIFGSPEVTSDPVVKFHPFGAPIDWPKLDCIVSYFYH